MPKEGRLQLIKYAPPPSRLPIYQRIDPREVSFFGHTNYEAALEEKKFIFGIKRIDRRHHMYIVGKGGVGKSKLLELLVRQDIAYGYGLCLLAPYEDLVVDILNFIPEERAEDVVIIDPTDTTFPIAFNPLQGVLSEQKHQFAQWLVDIIRWRFTEYWTPRLEHVLRFACLALLDYPNATLRGFISLLTDKEYREDVIRHVEDEMVRRFWQEEFAEWMARYESEAIIPLLNKLGQFLSNPLLRNIFAQKENKVDFGDIIAAGKIVIVRFGKNALPDDDAALLGSLMLMKIYQASTRRVRDEKDFYLYLDEPHYFMPGLLESFFAESSKYGICCTLAHQFRAQLLPGTLATILGNVGTIVVFRAGAEDASAFEKEMAPVFSVKDIMNLGQKEFYIKMMIDGNIYEPFSAETLKVLPPPRESSREAIIKLSRKNYAVPADIVKANTRHTEELPVEHSVS